MTRKELILIIVLACSYILTTAQDGSVPPRVVDGVSLPGDFPEYVPVINEETAPGHIFITNSQGTPYLMILKNNGAPYFYWLLENPSFDFKLQANGMLTGWIMGDPGGFLRIDEHLQVVDTIRCQNGFETDRHELQLLPDGHALMIAREERNMTLIDQEGNPIVVVIGNHIQELDETGQVVFLWECWDHFNLEDTYVDYTSGFSVDYVHMNSIDVDFDGHLLVSNRHLSECTKINRQTGEIIWRLGGKNNEFNFTNDPDQFSYQHDFRPVPGKAGYYTMFDNGNLKDPRYSRAVEYSLDTVNMIAEKVWEYRHDPERYSRLMGNAQRLPNGNTLINWGDQALPKVTEVRPDSTVVYEADFTPGMNNYRTLRYQFDYAGSAPYLLVEPYPDRTRLLINKFGDDEVDYYNIYAGSSPEQLDWIDSTSLPWIDLLDLEGGRYHYLEVTAVDIPGLESPPSKLEKVYVRNSQPGDNLILNGDFSDGESFWSLQNLRDGNSAGSLTDSSYHFNISAGGTIPSDIQLSQIDIPLIHGKEYILELDARASSARTIRVEMERNALGVASYSKHGMSYIGTDFTHIEHTFMMEDPNDLRARCVIYGGGSDIDFEVSNISLRQKGISGTHQQKSSYKIITCSPNPANRETLISFETSSHSKMHLQLFTLTGQLVKTIFMGSRTPGGQEIGFNTSSLDPGVYILSLYESGSSHSCLLLIQQ